jgi:hypothetical protein
VVIHYPQPEGYYALPPDSLADEAQLVSFDPAGACFAVQLRNLQEEGQWSVPSSYEITLEADDRALPPPQVQVTQPVARQYQGQVPEQHVTGSTTVCMSTNANTGACERWDTQPVYSTVMVPGIITVVEGGGTVCFQNDGALTPSTQLISLVFRGPGGMLAHRFTFEWEFIDPMPPAAPPGQAVAAR